MATTTTGTGSDPNYEATGSGAYWWLYPHPRDCHGDVHVFSCARCKTCRCGQATLTKKKARK